MTVKEGIHTNYDRLWVKKRRTFRYYIKGSLRDWNFSVLLPTVSPDDFQDEPLFSQYTTYLWHSSLHWPQSVPHPLPIASPHPKVPVSMETARLWCRVKVISSRNPMHSCLLLTPGQYLFTFGFRTPIGSKNCK